MASEDLFDEDFSEEIITQLDQDYAENVEIMAEEEPENGEDADENIVPTTKMTEEPVDTAEATSSEEMAIAAEPDSTAVVNDNTPAANSESAKLFQLPLARVRNIMKLDPDLHIASNEAVFLVTRATELFIESLAVESYSYTAQSKKKTVQKRDVDLAISAVDSLMFLDGAMAF